MTSSQRDTRRSLLRNGAAVGLACAAGSSASFADEGKEEVPVSPTEDLMREHGLLDRILLIYELSLGRLRAGKDFPSDEVKNAASIIHSFIEDYHEKEEENFVFPIFEKANKLVDLVKTLRTQHESGRKLTESIQELASKPKLETADEKTMGDSIRLFIRMYRPHKAREDTVLFPALHEIVTKKEFDELGEEFERKEHQLFGKEGFDGIVQRVAEIEKKLGIYDLAQFTPPT